MKTNETMWYLLDKEQNRTGPHTTEQLMQLAQTGQISLNFLSWREGLSEWRPLGETEPFATALRASDISSETIQFCCECGNQITMDRRYANYTVQCDACGRNLVVPGVALVLPVGAVMPDQQEEHRGIWRSLLLPLSVLVCLVLTGVIVGLIKIDAAGPSRKGMRSIAATNSTQAKAVAPKPEIKETIQDTFIESNQTTTVAAQTNKEAEKTVTQIQETPGRLYIVRKNGKYGFMDQSGRVVIEPRFLEVRDFHEGLACVAVRTASAAPENPQSANMADPDPDRYDVLADQTQKESLANRRFYPSAPKSKSKSAGGKLPKLPLTFPQFNDPSQVEFLKTIKYYGYINTAGELVIPAQFCLARDFSEGFALVLPDTVATNLASLRLRTSDLSLITDALSPMAKYASISFMIDKTGKRIWSGIFGSFSEGVVAKMRFERMDPQRPNRVMQVEFMDGTGNTVFQTSFARSADFSEGLVRIGTMGTLANKYRDPLWGYLNKRGEVVIKPQFSEARDFHEGLAIVPIKGAWIAKESMMSENTWGYIDQNSTLVIDPSRNSVKAGDELTECRFEEARDFSGGVAAVRVRRIVHKQANGIPQQAHLPIVWSLIDREGRIIEATVGGECGSISEGLARRREYVNGGRWGYMDKTGKMVIPFTFDEAEDFAGGLARVTQRGSWAYINKAGKYVWIEKPETLELPPDHKNYYPEPNSTPGQRGGWGLQVMVPDGESSGTLVEVYEAPDRIPDNPDSFVFSTQGRTLIASLKTNSRGVCRFQGLKPPFFAYITRPGYNPEFRYVTSTTTAYNISLIQTRNSK